MDAINKLLWKGGKEPTSFPHVCPYRPDGADKKACIELGGSSYQRNIGGCGGAVRGPFHFGPCNSTERRCIVCLQIGRSGPTANIVTNIATGRCDEHAAGVARTTPRPRPVLQPRFRIAITAVDLERPKVIPKPIVSPAPLEVQELPAKQELPDLIRTRRKPAVKLAALEEAVAELREKSPQLQACDVIAAAAKKLRMTHSGLRTFYYREVSEETKTKWLYGEGGQKITRGEEKFNILMRVRKELHEKGDPKPRKKDLLLAAKGPLGMKHDSASTYIYERLTEEEEKALDLRKKFLTVDEQIAVLKAVRQQMKKDGLPAPRRVDLAKAAAPLLKQKKDSVRTLLGQLSDEVKKELEFADSRSGKFAGLDLATIKAGFLGAIAVLKLRKAAITVANLRSVLQLRLNVVTSYLAENPDVAALLDTSPKT